MTAAAKTTTASAAAISPHGFCWVTTLAGGRVRPLPPCPLPRWPEALLAPDPPRDVPLVARPFSGLGSLATAAPRCAAGIGGGSAAGTGPSTGPAAASVARAAVQAGPTRAGRESARGGSVRLL